MKRLITARFFRAEILHQGMIGTKITQSQNWHTAGNVCIS